MILITGATGTVGRPLVALLRARGVTVCAGFPARSFVDWVADHADAFGIRGRDS
jgi:uncharacterized protein YbjT (DUF2867 family)